MSSLMREMGKHTHTNPFCLFNHATYTASPYFLELTVHDLHLRSTLLKMNDLLSA